MTSDARVAVLAILLALTCLSLSRATPRAEPTGGPGATVDRSDQALALRDGQALDLNLATAQDLELLPGVGPSLAARIVGSRAAEGPFQRVEDLRRVRGIGQKTLARLAPFIRFGPPRGQPAQ